MAKLVFDVECFFGTGPTDEAARDEAAYKALQKTRFMFTDCPKEIVITQPLSEVKIWCRAAASLGKRFSGTVCNFILTGSGTGTI